MRKAGMLGGALGEALDEALGGACTVPTDLVGAAAGAAAGAGTTALPMRTTAHETVARRKRQPGRGDMDLLGRRSTGRCAALSFLDVRDQTCPSAIRRPTPRRRQDDVAVSCSSPVVPDVVEELDFGAVGRRRRQPEDQLVLAARGAHQCSEPVQTRICITETSRQTRTNEVEPSHREVLASTLGTAPGPS
ncbi:hypothetical protein NPS01_19390 [Nocardioides psychrotolerans]|nr:hypothetical protein NPS01_19390 [Nocardioides psychrotolerans]